MKDAVSDQLEQLTDAQNPLSVIVERFYHVIVLLGLAAFMLAVRLREIEAFQTESGVVFRGNDPWYHFRTTSYLLDHFPANMPFDIMTNYPTGTAVGQFGTLYDQIVAGFILLTTLGNPTSDYAGLIMIIAAPVFVTATIVPAYLIATRFTTRPAALTGVTVFALLPGTVLLYSMVGFYDHSAGEVFFQTLGVFGFIAAISVAQQTQPVWELIADRDITALRRPLLYSVGAGITAALYMWAWPPGILLVGFTGIFLALKITSDVYHDQSPEPIAFVGSISMFVAGLLMIVPLKEVAIASATGYNLLQIILPLGVGFGCLFLAFLARQWESRELDESWYPAVVGILLFVVTAIFEGFVGGLFNSLINRIGFSTGATARTVGEAKPPLSQAPAFEFIYSQYRLALFTAIVMALAILIWPLIKSDDTKKTGYVAAAFIIEFVYFTTPVFNQIAGLFGTNSQLLGLLVTTGLIVGATFLNRYDAGKLYLVIWGGFILSAAFTQTRFNYYLAVVVAVFNALFIGKLFDFIDFHAAADTLKDSAQDLEGWQIMVGVTVVFLVIAPFMLPTVAAWDRGGNNGPGAVTIWDDSLEWMEDNTPTPGELGGADNALDSRGTYESPTDGDYDYPEGAYGVQSWWDYGHWITTQADRIPNANPFQQGAGPAAEYLLAPNETAANSALARKMGDDGETRYVMIDSQMANPNSKFAAPTVFNQDVNFNDFIGIVYRTQGQQTRPVRLRLQRYYESQVIRLYAYHGSAVRPSPVVLDISQQTVPTRGGGRTQIRAFNEGYQTFETLEKAKSYVAENESAILGGIGSLPREQVDALKHYRLIKTHKQNSGSYIRDVRRAKQLTGASFNVFRNAPSWVKTFEKVPGATVDGTGAPPGDQIRATVRMRIPSNGRTFSYTQYATADENGDFEMTLPYSTTGYENFGPENGYTNVSVRATSDYRFVAGQQAVGSAEVSEAQVVGVDDSPVQVELSQPTRISRQSIQATG